MRRKRGHESLKMKSGVQDQVGTTLNCAQQLPSGRTSAPCDTATQTSGLELCGFLQFNNRQVVPTKNSIRLFPLQYAADSVA